MFSLIFIPFMGSEFIPKLDEGAMVVQATRPPSISLSESVKTTLWIEKTLLKFPEVTQVVSRTGAPEVATDPDGLDLICGGKPKGNPLQSRRSVPLKEALIRYFGKPLLEF